MDRLRHDDRQRLVHMALWLHDKDSLGAKLCEEDLDGDFAFETASALWELADMSEEVMPQWPATDASRIAAKAVWEHARSIIAYVEVT